MVPLTIGHEVRVVGQLNPVVSLLLSHLLQTLTCLPTGRVGEQKYIMHTVLSAFKRWTGKEEHNIVYIEVYVLYAIYHYRYTGDIIILLTMQD